MVAVRLFKQNDDHDAWEKVSVTSYMPSFLSGEDDIQNINKRVQMRFLRQGSGYTKARWHYQSNEAQGFWVLSES